MNLDRPLMERRSGVPVSRPRVRVFTHMPPGELESEDRLWVLSYEVMKAGVKCVLLLALFYAVLLFTGLALPF